MGHEIEKVALERGHSVPMIFDVHNSNQIENIKPTDADIAIEFTTPVTAPENIIRCFKAGIPVVSGTTGWLDKMDEVKDECVRYDSAFFYASNYSIGVNILFYLNRKLAKLMNRYEQYEVSIRETHHVHKKDSPSGTAITLADDIIHNLERKSSWINGTPKEEDQIPVYSLREGEIPGIHRIIYESDEDTLELFHSAKSRRGFALGAVLAAEFLLQRKGCYGMEDLLMQS